MTPPITQEVETAPTGQMLSLWRGWIDVSMSAIAAEIADREGISVDELRGRNNPARLSTARREAVVRMRRIGRSLPQIARFMDRSVATLLRDLKLSAAAEEMPNIQRNSQVIHRAAAAPGSRDSQAVA